MITRGADAHRPILFLGWAGIRTLLKLWNAVETGDAAGRIYSGVFAATGVKAG